MYYIQVFQNRVRFFYKMQMNLQIKTKKAKNPLKNGQKI